MTKTPPSNTPDIHAGHDPDVSSTLIYQSVNFHVRYQGPDPAQVDRFIMTFPDLIHPTGPDAPGWGNAFLLKRGAGVISLTFEHAKWYQSVDFFHAVRAARYFVNARAPISSYGASMGGYGAILAGKQLGADRVIALCPQFSIEQHITPFEHRYRQNAADIGPFIHNISHQLSDDIAYFVFHDPTHNIDRKHVGLFAKPRQWHNIVQPGSSHGVLNTLIEAKASEALFDLIMGTRTQFDFRQTFRRGRLNSKRYIRRMGNLSTSAPHHTKLAQVMIKAAKDANMNRFVTRWQNSLAERNPPAYIKTNPLEEILLHVGLPKTGTTSLQTHMANNRSAYLQQGLAYGGDLADGGKYPPNHRWLSAALLQRNLDRLDTLRSRETDCPRLLLSDESLFVELPYIRRVAFKRFRAIFHDVPVRILICTRDKTAWKKSFYKQALEMRGRPGAQTAAQHWGHSDHFARFFERPGIAQLDDWDQILHDMKHRFGAHQVDKISMQPERDIVRDVVGHLGLTAENLGSEKRDNPSLTDLDAEILRQANAQGHPMHAMMRILIGLRDTAPPVRIKPRFLNTIRKNMDHFDWSALQYAPNPPLIYERDAFEQRKDILQRLGHHLKAGS